VSRADIIDLIVKLALREDVGRGDITSSGILDRSRHIRADIQAQENGILCGIEIAERVFRRVDENLRFLPVAKDGETVEKGREIAYIEGSAISILIAERTALNFLGHLSGVASLTRRYVEKVKGTSAQILDTRKTTPNLRLLEKYAVVTGGGINHRMGLYDQVLIKDNHLRILKDESIPAIVARAKKAVLKNTRAGVEVKNLKEFVEALKSKADYILLDNMTPATAKEAVTLRQKAGSKVPLEISGGVTLETVRSYAEAGVERISVGALTHSALWLDVSLDIVG
jgi:nicotinate-nucleotide pyrophosphorylase (carboxylating)